MPVDMKEKIAETLNQLLQNKKLDKITVKELVDACHISRQTFYYHFQDIMEVVEWRQQQTLRQAIEKSLAAPSGKEAMRGIVEEAFQNRELLRRLLSSQRHREIQQLLLKAVRAYLREVLLVKAPDLTISPADAEALLCFYSWGLVGMLLTSLEQKQPDLDALADRMYRVLAGELSLRTFRKPDRA